jgi:hypothetical protein
MDVRDKIKSILKDTVIDLVNSDFNNIQVKLKGELTIDDIREELSYWDSITIPPDIAYEDINFYKYDDGSGYALEFDLWIDNQLSDLTISCVAILDRYEIYCILQSRIYTYYKFSCATNELLL